MSVDKGVSLSPGGNTVCMQTSLSNHVLVCRPTGRGEQRKCKAVNVIVVCPVV